MGKDWCCITWGPWVPLERYAIIRTASDAPGVYRVRRQDGAADRLVYIGQTARSLRERLLALAAGVNADSCPFNDPHTAAPHLWLLRRQDRAQLECSCAPVVGDVQVLRGTEDMLLWRHRVTTGLSTEANYGRFYPGYTRPTNRWIAKSRHFGTRTPGRSAVPIAEGAERIDFTDAHSPLMGDAGPLQESWWQRAPLREVESFPIGPAIYIIHDRLTEVPIYIGETNGLRVRAAAHCSTGWPVQDPWLAYRSLPEGTPKHVLREFECDLLGWHFWQTGRSPARQYAKTAIEGKHVQV